MSLVCGCDIDEGPKVYRDSWPVARKEHQCCECGRTIDIGKEYHYECGIWECGAEQYKTCVDCAGLWESLSSIGFCIIYTELKSAYYEYLHDYLGIKNIPINHLTK